MSDWPTDPTQIIREALREYVSDGDGADEAVLEAHDAATITEVYSEVEAAKDPAYTGIQDDYAVGYRQGFRHALSVIRRLREEGKK